MKMVHPGLKAFQGAPATTSVSRTRPHGIPHCSNAGRDGLAWHAPCSSSYRKGEPMREQEARGKVKKTTGKVKEAVGILSGDKKLEREGAAQRAEGTIQEGLGKARREVGKVISKLGKAIGG